MSTRFSFARSTLLAAGLVAALGGAALAQQAPQGGPQPGDIEKILKAPLQPSHLAVATDVLKASGMLVMFENATPNVVGALRVNVTRQRPELAKDIEEALKVVTEESNKATLDGVSGAARFLAVRLSEPELKEISTFLNSPTGKKYVETLPGFMDMVVPYLQAWSQEVSGRLSKAFSDEMAKRGHKL